MNELCHMAISRPISGQGDEVSMPGVDPLLNIPRSKVRVRREGCWEREMNAEQAISGIKHLQVPSRNQACNEYSRMYHSGLGCTRDSQKG